MSGIDPGTLHLSRLGLEPKPRPCSTGANAWGNAISSLVLTLLQSCRQAAAESTLTQFLQIMKSPNSANFPGLEDKTFLLLVVVISLAFAWILWPFFGAVLWGTILAIMFAPLSRRLFGFMLQRR